MIVKVILSLSYQTPKLTVLLLKMYLHVKFCYCNSPQAVAREKLDKMREANETTTKKELEMTIEHLKVSCVSVVILRSKGGKTCSQL